jgi:hypothetical protein
MCESLTHAEARNASAWNFAARLLNGRGIVPVGGVRFVAEVDELYFRLLLAAGRYIFTLTFTGTKAR